MCLVSAVIDYHREKYPVDWYPQTWDYQKDIDKLEEAIKITKELEKLLREAKKYDNKTNQKNCSDKDKQNYLKEIRDIVSRIEKELKNRG